MIIHLELRDGDIILPKKEFDSVLDFDWFLNILVKFTNHINEPQDNVVKYTLWEEKNAVLSILDSLRYNKLIVYKTNLDYLIGLADKWCVPEWLINQINDRSKCIIKSKFININNLDSESNEEDFNKEIKKISSQIKKCPLCKTGFNLFDNTSTSCKRHTGYISQVGNEYKYTCCGYDPNDLAADDVRKNGCRIGFHIFEE
jgi:hypothetical protein